MEDDFPQAKPQLKDRFEQQQPEPIEENDSLYIDVNISEGRKQRIVVTAADNPA